MSNREKAGQIPLFETPGSEGEIPSGSGKTKVPPRKPLVKKGPRGREAPKGSGQVPEGDVRLTANVRQDLHLRLKIAAAKRRTTVGELIEEFVERYL